MIIKLREIDGYRYEVRTDKTFHRVCSPTKESKWVAPRWTNDIFFKCDREFKQQIEEFINGNY